MSNPSRLISMLRQKMLRMLRTPVTCIVQATSTRFLLVITLAMVLFGIAFGIRKLEISKHVREWTTRPYIKATSWDFNVSKNSYRSTTQKLQKRWSVSHLRNSRQCCTAVKKMWQLWQQRLQMMMFVGFFNNLKTRKHFCDEERY